MAIVNLYSYLIIQSRRVLILIDKICKICKREKNHVAFSRQNTRRRVDGVQTKWCWIEFLFFLTMIKIGHCKTVFLIINKKPMSPYSYLLIRYAKRAKEKKNTCCFFAWKHASSRRWRSNKIMLNNVFIFLNNNINWPLQNYILDSKIKKPTCSYSYW